MKSGSRFRGADFPFSTKDTILLILFGFSGLLCFALSFSLFQSDGRPYLFAGCLVFCLICLAFAEKKKELVLGTVAFISLRVVWAIAVDLMRHL
jgi:hypothetical protein